jgi:coatomer subunit beta
VATDLQRATGVAGGGAGADVGLTRTMQLTGLSDAVYAEAIVTTHQYDVVLDVTVINRTAATMQSLCLELATMGDLKLVERPQNYTLAAGESKRLRANIKARPALAAAILLLFACIVLTLDVIAWYCSCGRQ